MIGNEKDNKRSIRYAMVCHIYEHYENSLFNFVAPFIATVFFPQDTARLGIYIALTAGFLMSPFGATILSWVGDRYGRRRALLYAISLSIVPMFIVAFLPSYDKIGIISPILLILSRVIQGISIGGAFFATITFVTETSTPQQKHLNMGILLSMGFAGSLLGTLLAAFFSMDCMPAGLWRLTFFLGGAFGVVIYLMRGSFKESGVWKAARKPDSVIPLFMVIKEYQRNVWAVFLFGGSLLLPFYVMMTWLPGYMTVTFGIPPSLNLTITSILLFVSGVTIILFCWLASFLRLKIMMYASCFAAFISFYMVYVGLDTASYPLLLCSQIFVVLYTSFHGAAVFLIIQTLFPVEYKYSGFAVPFSLGKMALVMSSPLMAELILKYTQKPANISYLLLMAGVLIFLATYLAQPLSSEEAD